MANLCCLACKMSLAKDLNAWRSDCSTSNFSNKTINLLLWGVQQKLTPMLYHIKTKPTTITKLQSGFTT